MDIVILAGGSGSRMNSNIAKVLQKIAGQSFLSHLIKTAKNLNPNQIVIIQAQNVDLQSLYKNEGLGGDCEFKNLVWLNQQSPKGTADAVQISLPALNSENTLILYGDVPLITGSTLANLNQSHQSNNADITLLTKKIKNPFGYGRIVRNKKNEIIKICEQKDADETTLKIREINTGLMIVKTEVLKKYLKQIKNNGAQKEYYLTDIIELAVLNNLKIDSTNPNLKFEVDGVNSQFQLEKLERKFQKYKANQLLLKNTTLLDKKRIDIRGNLTCNKDVVIDINCIFEGEVKLDDGVKIGANCIIKNSHIQKNTQILPNSIIENSTIGQNNSIGPFARIRPETNTQDNVKIGNFVEVKKSTINSESKLNHLSYVGDSQIGKRVNIGAGVITCNYDGTKKHQSIIDDDCFIGSGSQLIAPIHLAKNTLVGAGSSLNKDTDENTLNLTRATLVSKKRR